MPSAPPTLGAPPFAQPRAHAEPQSLPPDAANAVFLSDAADGADLLEAAQTVQPLAQLCVTAQVQTPFLAAIAGPPGAGKSFALKRLAQMVEAFAGLTGALSRVVMAKVDASDGAEPTVALASAAYGALDREPGGVDYSALLDESAHAGGDPLRAAKAASDRHDEIVRKLEAERAQRDEVEARAARLAELAVVRDSRVASRRVRPRPARANRTRASAGSISPDPTPPRAIAILCATRRALGPAAAPARPCARSGPTQASAGSSFGRSSPSSWA